jgi:ribosomal protection tetracycline resistance protein
VQKSIRNIAIMAHADAGKTTLTEQFLFLSGTVRQPGNVDQGTTQTDFLPVEKERGISVHSAQTSFNWKNTLINWIDTPGHVDFSSDVERILRVPEGAVLVISAVEGVQAHTETLYAALREARIPVIVFVNKTDRVGADPERVIQEIRKELGFDPFCPQEITDAGGNTVSLASRWSEEDTDHALMEQIVATDEHLLNRYLEEEKPSFAELEKQVARLVSACTVVPLLFGSAKLGLGVEELLDAMVTYFPPPAGDPEKPLSALVYGISHDKTMGKVATVRVFDGTIRNRETIFNATQQISEKVIQVRRIFAGRFEDTGKVEAGDIAGLCGLTKVRIGDVLGASGEMIPPSLKLGTPLLTVQLKAESPKDYPALAEAMQELSAEDPSLEFEWIREESEMHVRIMGWIQMEILERILSDRFNLVARFENPTVIYKETPTVSGEGFVRYWMPKPCWAIMKFRLEPGERGSGVVYRSIVPVNDVQQKYQNEVERCMADALKQGIKGWEVTDLRITLIEGEDHTVHSRPGDFTIATPMGIMDGLVNTGTTLLEPMIRFKINAPDELLGAVTSDVTRMRGSFDSPAMDNGRFLLTGILPLSTSLDYPVKLSSRSGGKARISTVFWGYRECPDELGTIRPYKGISPLDTAKYILKARGAMQ